MQHNGPVLTWDQLKHVFNLVQFYHTGKGHNVELVYPVFDLVDTTVHRITFKLMSERLITVDNRQSDQPMYARIMEWLDPERKVRHEVRSDFQNSRRSRPDHTFGGEPIAAFISDPARMDCNGDN